jgi:hypothetical protein
MSKACIGSQHPGWRVCKVASYRLRRLSEGSCADEAGKQVWLLMGDWFSKILPGPLVEDSDFSGLDPLTAAPA